MTLQHGGEPEPHSRVMSWAMAGRVNCDTWTRRRESSAKRRMKKKRGSDDSFETSAYIRSSSPFASGLPMRRPAGFDAGPVLQHSVVISQFRRGAKYNHLLSWTTQQQVLTNQLNNMFFSSSAIMTLQHGGEPEPHSRVMSWAMAADQRRRDSRGVQRRWRSAHKKEKRERRDVARCREKSLGSHRLIVVI
ncbi:hypothetical protein EYF80_003481 [Liparis tanakae]|uniref:Uncharacterized protein n=1 Tax=Liparis tanakae TaxID=230148 RepID=A0A4Z2J875_9TELE|nr:hypothetical protein EYF80_003481 [Liparis tanakae]